MTLRISRPHVFPFTLPFLDGTENWNENLVLLGIKGSPLSRSSQTGWLKCIWGAASQPDSLREAVLHCMCCCACICVRACVFACLYFTRGQRERRTFSWKHSYYADMHIHVCVCVIRNTIQQDLPPSQTLIPVEYTTTNMVWLSHVTIYYPFP